MSDAQKLLFGGAYEGSVEKVKQALQQGADINYVCNFLQVSLVQLASKKN